MPVLKPPTLTPELFPLSTILNSQSKKLCHTQHIQAHTHKLKMLFYISPMRVIIHTESRNTSLIGKSKIFVYSNINRLLAFCLCHRKISNFTL